MFHFQNLRVFSMIRLPSMIFNSRPLSRSFWVWGLRFVGLAQRFFSSECLSLHASLKPLLSVGVRFLRIILPKTFRPSDLSAVSSSIGLRISSIHCQPGIWRSTHMEDPACGQTRGTKSCKVTKKIAACLKEGSLWMLISFRLFSPFSLFPQKSLLDFTFLVLNQRY